MLSNVEFEEFAGHVRNLFLILLPGHRAVGKMRL